MKTFKRIFSFLLVLSIIISTLPEYTYAQETKSNVEENVKNSAENFLANVNEEIEKPEGRIEFPMYEDLENVIRNNILIIDGSEKMKGKPFELQKQAALKF